MQQECVPFISTPPLSELDFSGPPVELKEVTQKKKKKKKKHSLAGQLSNKQTNTKTLNHVFSSKVQTVETNTLLSVRPCVCVILPSLVCALVICRSQSPARSFSLPMICLFRSFSVMCGPSNTTVS